MSTSTHLALQGDARVPRAVATLHGLSADATSKLIIARLSRRSDQELDLPACQKDEEPTSIFVDVIKFTTDLAIAERLRFASTQALRTVSFETAPDPDLLGDLCYLVAAIGAGESVDVLPRIISRDDAGQLRLRDGEDIRLRALRALIGLLAARPRRSSELKGLLEKLAAEPRYQVLALTGLVGLWPEDLHRTSQGSDVDEKLLDLNLELAGFGSAANSANARAR